MFIDKNTGTIELPNGLVISTEFSRIDFENSVFFSEATPYDYGTPPFQWYRLNGGQLDGHMLNINLCFSHDVLEKFSTSANFSQSNPRKWENFSLDNERQSKAFHDQLLQKLFGDPHKKTLMHDGVNQPGLEYRFDYYFKWGQVWSLYDSRIGSADIGVKYKPKYIDRHTDYFIKKAWRAVSSFFRQ